MDSNNLPRCKYSSFEDMLDSEGWNFQIESDPARIYERMRDLSMLRQGVFCMEFRGRRELNRLFPEYRAQGIEVANANGFYTLKPHRENPKESPPAGGVINLVKINELGIKPNFLYLILKPVRLMLGKDKDAFDRRLVLLNDDLNVKKYTENNPHGVMREHGRKWIPFSKEDFSSSMDIGFIFHKAFSPIIFYSPGSIYSKRPELLDEAITTYSPKR